ncbi:MAG: hypothetical protein EOP56_01410 [Sphingobacteriales bacterium]|nr:MAG: hypothetical protein EOP56_01410 [Sphingobacteriales bacterium]
MTIRNLLLAVFMLAGICAMAQSRLYLKPSVGIGFNNIRESNSGPITLKKSQPVIGYSKTLGIGYKKNKIGFETGIGYLKTGRTASNISLSTATSPSNISLEWRPSNHYVTVPLRMTYQLDVTKKFSVVPAVGGSFSYNISATDRIKGQGATETIKLPGSFHKGGIKTFGLFGEAQLNGSYRLNKNIDIFGGPSFQYMITDIGKKSANTAPDYKANPYTWGINAGINLYLSEPTKSADTPGN